MSWELLEIKLEEVSGPVQVFNFEAVLGEGEEKGLSLRGDGIYMTRTRQLRINRTTELTTLVSELVASDKARFVTKDEKSEADQKIATLVAELSETILRRISAQPQRRELKTPGQSNAGSPAPMMGSVAYYLEGKV
ncbi:MAG: hypothetical protein M3R04_03110 [bacterium]|nr:hypothetical protein [bacterium]